jgi:hypothetical protein
VSLEVAGEIFATRRALIARIRGILHARAPWAPLSTVDEAFVRAVLLRHPNAQAKIGVGIATIQTTIVLPYQTRAFEIVRVDGSRTPFSFEVCLRPPSPASRLRSALRAAVREDLFEFRVREFERYADIDGRLGFPVSGAWILPSEAHVDHVAPTTFEQLVQRFLREHVIDPNAVAFAPRGDGDALVRLADADLERAWRAFHREHARLRLIRREENLKRT